MFENNLQNDILEDNEQRTLRRKHLVILIILVGLIAILMISIIVISVTELSNEQEEENKKETDVPEKTDEKEK